MLPRIFWFIWWGTLVNRLGGFVIPLLAIYLTKVRGVSVPDVGGILSLYGAGHIAASWAGGQLGDRIGRRATILISMFGGAAAMLGLGLVHDLRALAAMVLLVGFAGELYRPAVSAVITDVVPPEQRTRAFGLLHWVINVGFAVAAAVGGFIAELDFSILFIADAATMAGYGVIVFLFVPETRPTAPPEVERPPPSRSWIFDRPFAGFVFLMFLLSILPLMSGAPLAAHMTAQHFPAWAYGLVMAANGVIIIVLQPSLSKRVAPRPPFRMLQLAALLYGVGIAMHGLYPQYLAIHFVAVTIWTLAEIVESPTRSTIVAAIAPIDARARYQGALTMSIGAGALVTPKLGTTVWAESPAALWLGCLGLGILVALGLSGRSRSGSS